MALCSIGQPPKPVVNRAAALAVSPSGSVTVWVTVVMTGLVSAGVMPASTHTSCARSSTWPKRGSYARLLSTSGLSALTVTASASPSVSAQNATSAMKRLPGEALYGGVPGRWASMHRGARFAGAESLPFTLWFACAASPAWFRSAARARASCRVAPLRRTTSEPSAAAVTAAPSSASSSCATV